MGVLRKIDSCNRGCVQLEQQRVGDTVARAVKRCSLRETSFDRRVAFRVRGLHCAATTEQIEDFIEVAGRHRANQWCVACKVFNGPERLLGVGAAEVIKILSDQFESLSDTSLDIS